MFLLLILLYISEAKVVARAQHLREANLGKEEEKGPMKGQAAGRKEPPTITLVPGFHARTLGAKAIMGNPRSNTSVASELGLTVTTAWDVDRVGGRVFSRPRQKDMFLGTMAGRCCSNRELTLPADPQGSPGPVPKEISALPAPAPLWRWTGQLHA